jgi:hypothetical protein
VKKIELRESKALLEVRKIKEDMAREAEKDPRVTIARWLVSVISYRCEIAEWRSRRPRRKVERLRAQPGTLTWSPQSPCF